ncbi:MAG: hypothetical protein ABEN55_17760 [Bradymonadaceae bacterium]
MDQAVESRSEKAALTGGVSTEVIGGIGGIVLGILALLAIQPMVLIPAATIAMGGAAFFGAGATEEMKDISFEQAGASRQSRHRASQGIAGAAGFQVFIGMAAAALGILALAGLAPLTLSLVAILSLGTSELISGAAVGGHMMQRIAA